MRKIFLFMMVSLDGFFEGPDHDLSWHNVDEEFNKFALEQTGRVDLMLFGRRTYEMMSSFWPSAQARQTDPQIASLMNNTSKIVFSKTMQRVEETQYWKKVRLIKDHVSEEIQNLKNQPGKDIAVFGSNNLCVNLLEMGLLDEIRIIINPVVIGSGTPLFSGIENKLKLNLVDSRIFNSGNVLLYYHPIL